MPTFSLPAALWGLTALPVLAGIYLLRNRSRRQVVSSLMLWADITRSSEGGRHLRRLQVPLLLILELLILALLVMAAADPKVLTSGGRRPIVVVLDDSLSMLAGGADCPRSRALAGIERDLRDGGDAPMWFVLAGADPGVVRVRNVTPESFEIRFQEWDYLDGAHCIEDAYYLVVERGAWQVDANTLLVADTLVTDNTDVYNPAEVGFAVGFSDMPVVVVTQQTTSGADAVTERLSNIAAGGFSVSLQEEEAGGRHCQETLGYVAVGQGTGGRSASADIRLGHRSPSDAELLVVEEQSADSETWHVSEDTGYIAVGGSQPGFPYFVADMQSCYGADTANLRCRQAVLAGLALPSASGVPGQPSPGSPAEGGCELAVCAVDGSGGELDGVEVVVGPDAEGEITVETTPMTLSCELHDSVTLTASESVFDGMTVLVFDYWEVDGQAQEPALLTIRIKMTGDRRAVAVYQSADAGPMGPAAE